MAVYAIGDLQGCYAELRRLLDKIGFDEQRDRLWFCGDLVNRGPDSLHCLRFVSALGERAVTVLGNHDLHLLALHHGICRIRDTETLQAVLDSPDREQLMHWLQHQPLLHYDAELGAVLVHAGIYPGWGLSQARKRAAEVERALRGGDARQFFADMYGNEPVRWNAGLAGGERLRFITNSFTRMRFLTRSGNLNFGANGSPRQRSGKRLTPWFERNARLRPDLRVLFGHWSTLPVGCYGRHLALDGGCVWGGHLVAVRIDKAPEAWFFVDSHTKKPIKSEG